MNRVFLMGHLGHAPELLESKNGKPYARLAIATNRVRYSEGQERETFTDWHSVFVWGKQAENCAEYLQKGALVFVEGHLSYWQPSNEKLYKTAVQAERVQFLNTRQGLEAAFEGENLSSSENLDNSEVSRNHNAVAHPA
jgi:single-strand DNA-binding protein